MANMRENAYEHSVLCVRSSNVECSFRPVVGMSEHDASNLLLVNTRTIVRFQATVGFRKRASLRGVSLEYLKCSENDTYTDLMLHRRKETVDESDRGEHDNALFLQEFKEFVKCSTSTNTDFGNQCDAANFNQAFVLVECRQYAENSSCCTQNRSKLIAYEKQKAHLFKVLTENFPDSKKPLF